MDGGTAPASRLARLEGWLAEDPGNAALLAEACEAALAAGRHDRALACVQSAQALGADDAAWTVRHAHVRLARRELGTAAELLESARLAAGDHPALAHDLAFIHFLQGAFGACRTVLRPWVAADALGFAGTEQAAAVQVLWLRACHHAGALEEALAWACAMHAAGSLQPEAQGVASLIALDADDFTQARALADAALAQLPAQPEALVARGCVALAEQDAAVADRLLRDALARSPEDGRIWSALGLASLQAQAFGPAQQQLEEAVRRMPAHIGTWHALGWARLLRQDLAGASEAFRTALALDRNFAESHGALGLACLLGGHAEAAQDHLQRADRLDPGNVTGRFARAWHAGEARDAESLQRLAGLLLRRPGFFGRDLGQAVQQEVRRRLAR